MNCPCFSSEIQYRLLKLITVIMWEQLLCFLTVDSICLYSLILNKLSEIFVQNFPSEV